MKKQLLIVFLLLALVLTACGKPTEDKSTESSNLSESTPQSEEDSATSEESEESEISEDESMDISDETSAQPIERTWPHVTGTFIQPWACANWTVANWKTHFKGLKEVGIDIFIVQWIADTPEGKFENVYYPSSLTQNNRPSGFKEYPNMLPNLLEAAEELGIKVFVGLNNANEWWSYAVTKNDWNIKQSKVGIDIATEIYDKYKSQYPNALHGWYFVWEMYNGMSGYETKAGEFLNMYLDPLTELDASMPMLLSPYVRSSGGNAKKAEEEWKKVFATANFREGDIFCCQDAVGAGHITINQLDAYFAALKAAVDTEEGLIFWANSENFTQDFQSAYLSRFLRQMEIARPYVSGYVTFAYSHYYAKDYNGKAAFHRAYKYYYDTGDTQPVLENPEISYTVEEDKAVLNIVCKNNNAGIEKVVISVSGRGDTVKNIALNQLDKDEFTFKHTVSLKSGESKITVKVTVNDYYGSISEKTIDIDLG